MNGLEGEADVSSRLVCNFREIGHTLRAVSEGKGSQKRILIILRPQPQRGRQAHDGHPPHPRRRGAGAGSDAAAHGAAGEDV